MSSVQHNIADANVELIFALGALSLVAVEICLGANIGHGVVEQAGLAIISKQAIEGLDVRVNRQLEGRVCGVILGRVSEEILSS